MHWRKALPTRQCCAKPPLSWPLQRHPRFLRELHTAAPRELWHLAARERAVHCRWALHAAQSPWWAGSSIPQLAL